MSSARQRYEQLLQRPEVRSLLNTIRYAEGTPGESGYRTMFGGSKFDVSKGWRHPDKVIKSGGYSSAAAGGYQYLPGTWQGAAKALGLSDFSPKSQDLGALYLIDRRGGLDPFLKGEKFGTVINKLAPEWASLPTSSGGSYYGQPSKPLGDLYKYYEQQKQQLAGQNVPSQQQAQVQQQTQQTPQTIAQQPGVPTINLIINRRGREQQQEQTDPFMNFLSEFTKARQEQISNVPSPIEIAQSITNAPRVEYLNLEPFS